MKSKIQRQNLFTIGRAVWPLLAVVVFLLSSSPVPVFPFMSAEEADAAGCSEFRLLQPATFPLSSGSISLRAADVNNDGNPDLVAVLPDAGKVSVQLGNGEGGIISTTEFAAGSTPKDLELGDFDRDGEIDIVVANEASNQFSILLGDGAGNFTLSRSVASAGGPAVLEVGDFDNDGFLDVAVGNHFLLKIFRGERDVNFSLAYDVTVTMDSPSNLKSGDFNRDGKLDLAGSYDSGNGREMRVFLGEGNGNFVPGARFTDIFVNGFAIGDFDNDGNTDLVAADYQRSRTLTYKGNGDGTFQPAIASATGTLYGVEAFDLNADGKLDLISTGAIFLGNGAGGFTFFSALGIGSSTSAIGIADFNSDERPDFAMVSGTFGTATGIAFNTGQPIFTGTTAFTSQRTYDLDTADFNGDGKNDIVAIDLHNNTAYVFLQDAEGYMVSTQANGLPLSGGFDVSGFSVRVGDFNGDGKPDFTAADSWTRKVFVFTGNGDGTFVRTAVELAANSGTPRWVRVGEFNGDDKLDIIAFSDSSRNFTVLLNDGNGGFTALSAQSLGSNGATDVVVRDFNKDGKRDLIIARPGEFNLMYLTGNGDGTFATFQLVGATQGINEIVSDDFDGDGILDLAVSAGGLEFGALRIFYGTAADTFESPVSYQTGSSAWALKYADFDLDGIKDFVLSTPQNSSIEFVKGRGNRMYDAATRQPVGTSGFAMTANDFNNDGKIDLAFASRVNSVIPIKYNATNVVPCLSVNDGQVGEGNGDTASFDVSLSRASTDTVSVGYKAVGRTARPGSDFVATEGSIVFEPGTTHKTVSVTVLADQLDEDDETISLTLVNPVKAAISDGVGTAKILDDDDAPGLTIGGATLTEGSGGVVTAVLPVNLSGPSGRKLRVRLATQNGTAESDSDYYNVAESFFIPQGGLSKNITVQIVSDYRVEPDETFTLNLTNPLNVSLLNDSASIKILDDDVGGVVQFAPGNTSLLENGAPAQVMLTRTDGNASDIVVSYQTSDGTAKAGQDYVSRQATVTIGANETSKAIFIPITNDSLNEDAEDFGVTLTGISGGATLGARTSTTVTIIDSDPMPALKVNGIQVTEGNSGTKTVGVSVLMSSPSGRTVEVKYATANGTAVAPGDYEQATGTITFAAGETSKTIQLVIVGDTSIEPNETFDVQLSEPTNATISTASAKVTIQNDDFGHTKFDFDGDGKADLAVRRPADNVWYFLRTTAGYTGLQYGEEGDMMAPADYDGDGKTDVAVFRPSTGTWFVAGSSVGFYTAGWGRDGDVPVPADYDGDGRADIAVYRPSDGTWYRKLSSGALSNVQFGTSEDKPQLGDYDGDGKADLAVLRPSNNTWYFLRTSAGFTAISWGAPGDIASPADFDGDGKTDPAVFRPPAGVWFIAGSSSGFSTKNWGASGDMPVVADYDGDGKADAALFRPSNNTWYLLQSTNGIAQYQFGANGDKPVPSVFSY